MASVLDILTPSRVRTIVSRIRTPGSVLSRHLGMSIGGSNVVQVKGNVYTYDIFDNVRSISRGRLLGSPAASVAKNPVGTNTVRLARAAEKMALDYNTIHNIRRIGENAGNEDRMGMRYVEKQAQTLKQRQDNFREFAVGALFRGGKYYFTYEGESLVPTYTSSGSLFGVDLKFDSTHVSESAIDFADAVANDPLQMGTGSTIISTAWSDASADILGNLTLIDGAFQRQVGAPLSRIYTDHQTWNYILANTAIRNRAGTSAAPTAEHVLEPDKAPDGTPTGLVRGKIVAIPWYTFYMYQGGLEVGTNNTYTKLLPPGYCTFMIEPGDWMTGVEGSEVVLFNDWEDPHEETGFVSWMMKKADPARFELHTLQNFGIELSVPKGIAYARVRDPGAAE